MKDTIRSLLETGVKDGVFPGGVVAFIHRKQLGIIPAGRVSSHESSLAVTKDTIYDVASITKSIPTSSLALYLIDQGHLQLSDHVSDFLPEFVHHEVTIWHLLTQTLSFAFEGKPLRLALLKDKSPDEILQIIYTASLLAPAGAQYSYCNATSILLGQVVEAVSKTTLSMFADEVFFQPLGMKLTSFLPDTNKQITAPSEYVFDRGGDICGVVHDESAASLRKKYVVGSAGLFSTAPDLLTFLSMLIDGGATHSSRYFSERMLQQMITNQLRGGFTGLGWELNQPQYMGKYSHPHMAGKTGFTGCVVMFDLQKKAALVFLNNATYPQRKPTSEKMNWYRRMIADIVFAD